MFDGVKEYLGPIREKERHALDLTIPNYHSDGLALVIYDVFSGNKSAETPVAKRYEDYLNSPFTYFGLDIHSDESNVTKNGNRFIGVRQNLLSDPSINAETGSVDIFHAHKPLIYGSESCTHDNLDKKYDPAELVHEAHRTLRTNGRFVLSLDAHFLNSQFMEADPQVNYQRLLQAVADDFHPVAASFDPNSSYGKDIQKYFPDLQPDQKLARDTFTMFETIPVILLCEKK